MSDRDVWPDNWKEAVAVPLLIGFVLFGTLQLVQSNPALPWTIDNAGGFLSAASTTSGEVDEYSVPQGEVEYVNRIYRELNTGEGDGVGETGFCVVRNGESLSFVKAGTIEASESSLVFTTANCRAMFLTGEIVGTLHFHPPNSRPVLSGPDTAVNPDMNDKKSFLDSSFELSCVQAGLSSTSPGSVLDRLRCFQKPGDGNIDSEFPRVELKVTK